MNRYRFVLACLVVTGLPSPGRAQERLDADWRIRAEAGPGKVSWWGQPGIFAQLGVSLAASTRSPFAIDLKLIDGIGGDGPTSNSEGFLFLMIGPEFRFLPAAALSPFASGHVGIGFDEDGGMSAATGEVGLIQRLGRRAELRGGALYAPGDGAWSLSLGVGARL